MTKTKYLFDAQTFSIWNNNLNEEDGMFDEDGYHEPYTIVSLYSVEAEYDADCDVWEMLERDELIIEDQLNTPSFDFETVDFQDETEYEMFDTIEEGKKHFTNFMKLNK